MKRFVSKKIGDKNLQNFETHFKASVTLQLQRQQVPLNSFYFLGEEI